MLNDTTPLKVCKDEENNKLFNEYIARSRPDGVSDERLQEIVNHALDIVADRYYDDCHDWGGSYYGGPTHETFIESIVKVKSFFKEPSDFVKERWRLVASVMFANELPVELEQGKMYDDVLNKFFELPQDQRWEALKAPIYPEKSQS